MPNRGIADKCNTCESFIFKAWDKDTYKADGRCYHCQLNYELDLEFDSKLRWFAYRRLKEFKNILNHRKKLFEVYLNELSKNKNIICVNDDDKRKKHSAWLFTILLEKKDYLQKKLKEKKIETNQVHFRNDKYSIFKKFAKNYKFPNMDFIENKYLVLPLHSKISQSNAKYICKLINKFIVNILY